VDDHDRLRGPGGGRALLVHGARLHRVGSAHEQRIRTAATKLLTAGATLVREIPNDTGTLDHLWMSDPEGNDFCVV
jgi:hypothetical protein